MRCVVKYINPSCNYSPPLDLNKRASRGKNLMNSKRSPSGQVSLFSGRRSHHFLVCEGITAICGYRIPGGNRQTVSDSCERLRLMPPMLKSEVFADAKKACTIKEGFNAEKSCVAPLRLGSVPLARRKTQIRSSGDRKLKRPQLRNRAKRIAGKSSVQRISKPNPPEPTPAT